MFCKNCGTELPDGTRFCSNCNANLLENNIQPPQMAAVVKTKNKNVWLKKKYTIAMSLILSILIVAVLLFLILVLPNMAVNDFKSQIKNRQYYDAYSTYEELDSEDQTKANKWLIDYIGSIEEDYYKGKLDYHTASGILDELTQFGATYNKSEEASSNIYLDNRSSIAFERAKAYANEKKWQEAYVELQEIHIRYRLYDEVQSLRAECVTNIRADTITLLDDLAARGKIDELIVERDYALLILPDDKEIILAAQKHLDTFVTNTLADAKILADNKDHAGAMDLLQYAVSMYNHQDFWSALDGYSYDSAKAHCEALVGKDDLAGAVKYAKGLADTDPKYNDLLEKYANPFVQKILSNAQKYADKRQYTDAVATITDAQNVYDCNEFVTAVENYSQYTPRKITQCHVIDRYDATIGVSVQDCFGRTYDNSLALGGATDKIGYIVFYLDGKFVNLDGIFVGSSELYRDMTVACRIYGDGKLLYESEKIGRTSEPVAITVDVTGVKQLRIETSTYTWSVSDNCSILDLTVS